MTKMALKSKVKYVLFLITITCLFYNCTLPNSDGFELEEFTIDNFELQSVVDSVVEMYSSALQPTENRLILSLNLSHKDSVLFFIFTMRNEYELINRYIYWENKRIVGYTNIKNTYLILLSDIDNLPELGKQYGRFIHPTGGSKVFSYIKFPKKLYANKGACSWPDFEMVYDPTYIVYPYVNNRFLHPVITTNIDYTGYSDSPDQVNRWLDR